MIVRSIRYLIIAVLTFSTLLGTVGEAVAQNTTKVTEITQRTIGYDQSWSEVSSESDVDSGVEFVLLQHVDGGNAGFIFSNIRLDEAQVRDATLESTKSDTENYTVIDSGQYDNVAYELAHYGVSGEQQGIFVLVVNTPTSTSVVMVTGPVDIFKDVVGRVQAGVTLDGAPVLEGVDGAGLQTQLQVTDASSVPTTDELANINENQSETGSTETDTSAGGSEFTSPDFGYTVTYPEPWIIGGQEVGEFDLASFEPLTLVSFSGIENHGFTGADLEMALTDTFIESLGSGGELIGSWSNQGSALFIGVSDGMLLIQEVIVISPEVAVIVTAVADGVGTPEAVYANLRTITVNGTPLLTPLG